MEYGEHEDLQDARNGVVCIPSGAQFPILRALRKTAWYGRAPLFPTRSSPPRPHGLRVRSGPPVTGQIPSRERPFSRRRTHCL